MEPRPGERRIPPRLWTLLLVVAIVVMTAGAAALFNGTFTSYVPVTLSSERAGLVMEAGAKVKLRGVQVGRVGGIDGHDPTRLQLQLFPDEVKYIPSNVEAQIRATTVFGAKYVELVIPDRPSGNPIRSGAQLISHNVSTEVNTIFENLVDVLHRVDPPKLNAVLTAFADGLRGQGQRIGEATTSANEVLQEVNPRMDTVREDWKAFDRFNDTYAGAAQDLLKIVDSFSTTSESINNQSNDLNDLLLNAIGFSKSGIELLAPNGNTLVDAINTLEPTTDLLFKYNPVYTCSLQGATWWLNNGAYAQFGGNGRSLVVDTGLLFGDDPYRYPENLPIVGAKGGPDGKPGCGSLPDATKNFPVRQLITNTGFGTGLDWRPNPGIGHPFWVNYLPTTRAVPEPPSIRGEGPPAIGPVPYPGAPAYGAPLYGPDGAPLYPPPPGAPPPPPAATAEAAPPMSVPGAVVVPAPTDMAAPGRDAP